MKKGELKEEILKFRETWTKYHMDFYFKELVFKSLYELCQLQINYGVMTKESCIELLQDLSCICGLDPVVEGKKILVIELYSYSTGLEFPENWFEQYRDMLENKVSGSIRDTCTRIKNES